MRRGFIGCGGHAREIAQFYGRPDVVLSEVESDHGTLFLGMRVQPLGPPEKDVSYFVAIGDSRARERIGRTYKAERGEFLGRTYSCDAVVGDGAVLLAPRHIGPDVVIGEGAHVHVGAQVHHDSHVGDFAFVGPGALLLGNVRVGHAAYIGAGAIILPGRRVGDFAVVGAGAVVTHDVPDGDDVVVVGVPGRPR